MEPVNENVEINYLKDWIDDFSVYVVPDTHTCMPWHTHDFYELVLVLEGFCFHHIQGTVSLVMEGDVFLVEPDVRHQYSGTRECKIINCLFQKEALTDDVMKDLLLFLEMHGLSPDAEEVFPKIHLDVKQYESVKKKLEQILKEYQNKKDYWQVKIKSLLHSVLTDYVKYYNACEKRGSAENRYSPYLKRAIQYVEEHYAEELTVTVLADAVGVTPDHLSRKFRMAIGVAAHDYIQQYRISRALDFLQQGYPVGDVAKKCGFNTIFHFSRVFKKEIGIPPLAYKQRLTEIITDTEIQPSIHK